MVTFNLTSLRILIAYNYFKCKTYVKGYKTIF